MKGYAVDEIPFRRPGHSAFQFFGVIAYFLREFNISNCARASGINVYFSYKILVHLLINLYIEPNKRILLRIETRFPVNLLTINIKCDSDTF